VNNEKRKIDESIFSNSRVCIFNADAITGLQITRQMYDCSYINNNLLLAEQIVQNEMNAGRLTNPL